MTSESRGFGAYKMVPFRSGFWQKLPHLSAILASFLERFIYNTSEPDSKKEDALWQIA